MLRNSGLALSCELEVILTWHSGGSLTLVPLAWHGSHLQDCVV
jgi:hypothetical protein